MDKKPFLIILLAGMVMMSLLGATMSYATTIPSEQKTCTKDEDCTYVRTSCASCCASLSDSVAVNNENAKNFESLGACTPEHIKSCGVPECGLMSPAPRAACRAGQCTIVMSFQGKDMDGSINQSETPSH